jgi:hypothetical protein
MRSVLVIAATLCLTLGAARAGSKDGVTLPDSVQVAGKTLVLNGMGTREATVFNVNVYVAGLYLEAKSQDEKAILKADGPKQLDMVFVRDVDKDDIQEAMAEGFKKNGGDMNALKDRLAKFNGWMSDMKKKDVMTFTYDPAKGTTVKVKGQEKGTIEGADFGAAVFGNFIGPKPPNGGLKKGLLGK